MRLWSALLALVLISPVSAQEPEKAPSSPVFQQLFPEPTGANGYEEIVMAGDLVRGSQTMAAAEEPGATLAAKRRALGDPKNRSSRQLAQPPLSHLDRVR